MHLAIASALLLLSTAAQAQSLPGDESSGRNLARRICSDCHVTAPDQARPMIGGAPAFQAIARAPATTALSLRVFLQSPHRNMPNLILTPTETDDLVSYILSLRR